MKIKHVANIAESMDRALATMVNNKRLSNYHAEMSLNTDETNDDININVYVMPVMPLKHIKVDFTFK
jgi:hypothetical protein